MKAAACNIPSKSKVQNYLDCVYYWDSFEVSSNKLGLDIREIYLGIFAHMPIWINQLILVRNIIVSAAGLKGPTSKELKNIEQREKVFIYSRWSAKSFAHSRSQ